jgi:hypothetical protein
MAGKCDFNENCTDLTESRTVTNDTGKGRPKATRPLCDKHWYMVRTDHEALAAWILRVNPFGQ